MKDNILSVIIITKNEEDNLLRCLESLPKDCEIILVDDESSDRTLEIAKQWGCKTFLRKMTDFADQKNFALEQATGRWVLAVDADEVLVGFDENLVSRLDAFALSGLYVARQLVFMGRVMRFGKTSDAPLRMFLREKSRFHGSIHEAVKVDGTVTLTRDISLLHYSYKDLSDYFQRFNRYTSAVAHRHHESQKKFSMFFHVLRPWAEFINRYFLRLGFLDGYPGYTYALISSIYAFTKYAKLVEKRSL